MQEIQALNRKLDLLLKKYGALRAEKEKLDQVVAEQSRVITGLNEKLDYLEQHVQAMQLDRGFGSEEDKTSMRHKLDNAIGEIDKILETLND